jgi:hypothetical protein
MYEASDEKAENAQSQRLCREDQTAQHSAAQPDNAHSWHLGREDQTDQQKQQKQKTTIAGASAARIRLLSVRQQKVHASPTAGTAAVKIRLSNIWRQ